MRILVSGGAGYVGSVLVPALLSSGHEVRVLDALLFGGDSLLGVLGHERCSFVRGDIRSAEDVRAALDDIEAVIHLAALVGDPACAADPERTKAINHEGAVRLGEIARRHGVGRFLLVSTCSNYGIGAAGTALTEESDLNPVSLYATTKVAAEQAILGQNAAGFATTVVRLATVFGLSPRMRFDLLVNEWVRDAVVSGSLLVYGPTAWRPFIHVRDAARALQLCVESPVSTVGGEVFNVGGTSIQKLALAELIRDVVGRVELEVRGLQQDVRDYHVSFEKAARVLDFQPHSTLPKGIAEIRQALVSGVIAEPNSKRYSNA